MNEILKIEELNATFQIKLLELVSDHTMPYTVCTPWLGILSPQIQEVALSTLLPLIPPSKKALLVSSHYYNKVFCKGRMSSQISESRR